MNKFIVRVSFGGWLNQCGCSIGVDSHLSLSVHVVFVTMAACVRIAFAHGTGAVGTEMARFSMAPFCGLKWRCNTNSVGLDCIPPEFVFSPKHV